MSRVRSRLFIAASVAVAAVVTATSFTPPVALADSDEFSGWSETPWLERVRHDTPADRYEPAGGCYRVGSDTGVWLTVDPAGGTLGTSTAADQAAPLRFQATELGRYLLYTNDEWGHPSRFVAGVESQIAASSERADAIAAGDGLATAFVPVETETRVTQTSQIPARLSSAVGLVDTASWMADWRLDEVGRDDAGHPLFGLVLPAPGAEDDLPHATSGGTGDEPADADAVLFDQSLVVYDGRPDGALSSVRRADAQVTSPTPLRLEQLADDRCATFPEMAVDVDGEPVQANDLDGPVRGYVDAHIHLMATEFLGGRAHCGDPWHRWGVEHAMVDCDDHAGGVGGILEAILSGRPSHDTTGWPTFTDWPRHDSLTHEGTYHRWVERAWRSGLRTMTVLLVENSVLCDVYPLKENSCDEMDSVRLQARRVRQLENYIDAQYGGPGNGWFRIVTSPAEARRVINSGRMAVVLGIEVSEIFGCRTRAGRSECTRAEIDQQLDEVYDLGVRQMELVNKFDNSLSGVAGDGGTIGPVVNLGNFYATGSFWKMEDCTDDGHDHHAEQPGGETDNHQITTIPAQLHNHDALAEGVLSVAGVNGAAPIYTGDAHCNSAGLTDLGRHLLRRMADKGMIFDPDHMSARARDEALGFMQQFDNAALLSSHSWSGPATVNRIYAAGGFVTPYAGGACGFVNKWIDHRQRAIAEGFLSPGAVLGFGYGSDINGFGSQGGPRNGASCQLLDGTQRTGGVDYDAGGFAGLDGTVTVHQHTAGFAGTPESKTYDVNSVGVAHYGLYPDWIEDLRSMAGDAIVEDLAAGSESFLQLWQHAES